MPLVPALVMLGLMAGAHGDSKPVFVKVPEDQIGLSGGVASFVCQATGEPKPRITWMKKGKKVSSQRFEVIEFDDGAGSVLRIQPLRVQRDEAIYECTATNSLGEINTSAKLSVLEEDQLPSGFPTIDMGPQLKVVEKARTATMLCAAGGNQTLRSLGSKTSFLWTLLQATVVSSSCVQVHCRLRAARSLTKASTSVWQPTRQAHATRPPPTCMCECAAWLLVSPSLPAAKR